MGCSTSKMFSKKQLRRLRIRNEDVMEMLKLSKDEFNTLSKEFFNLARMASKMARSASPDSHTQCLQQARTVACGKVSLSYFWTISLTF